jgi:ABC-type proline/glycine betaine transport system permease subunit
MYSLLPIARVFSSTILASSLLFSTLFCNQGIYQNTRQLRFICFFLLAVSGLYYGLTAVTQRKKIHALNTTLKVVHTIPWCCLVVFELYGIIGERLLIVLCVVTLMGSVASANRFGVSGINTVLSQYNYTIQKKHSQVIPTVKKPITIAEKDQAGQVLKSKTM